MGKCENNAIIGNNITDIDGNVYQTVRIGNQVWMAENLKVTHYRNGEAILKVTDNVKWSQLTTGSYCAYDNDGNKADIYGNLYNWYVVNDSRDIAPSGWHVPSDEEWKELEMYLGMDQSEADYSGWRGTDEGGKLKETGLTHWNSPNMGATNQYDFAALPGGYRGTNASFYYFGEYAFFWSATIGNSYFNTVSRGLSNHGAGIYRQNYHQRYGFSIRLVQN